MENGTKIKAVKQEKPDEMQDGEEEDYQMIFIKREKSEEDQKDQDYETIGHLVETNHEVNKTWPSDEIRNLVPVQYIFVPDNPQGEAPSVSEPTSYILVNVGDHRYDWRNEMGMQSFIRQEARTDSGMHDIELDKTFHCLGWVRADMEHALEGGILGHGGIEKRYQCSVCQRRFRETSHLSSHMKVHGEKVFQCSLCQRRFWGMHHLLSHMRSHRAKKSPSCDAGSSDAGEELAEQTRTIRENMRMQRAKEKLSGSGNADKELAEQTQTIREDMRMHRAKEKPSGSGNADKELGEQTQTRRDMRSHRAKEKSSCDAGSENAGKELGEQTQTIREDMRMQRAEEKPSCDAGRENAGEEPDAAGGDETQTRIEPLKCRICSKEFSSRNALTYHVTRHAAQKVLPRKPLVRDEPSGHEDRHEWKKKRRVVKPGKYQPRKCAICYEELRDRLELTEHLRKHRTDELHKSPRIGSRCNEASHKTVDLSEHTGKHRADMHYTCTVCSQAFSNSI